MGGVRIRIETRILHVIWEVPEYDLSVTAVEQADEEGTDCFQFQIDAVKQEAPSALAVKEQSLSMKLELPEWVSIQQQNITWNQTTNRLQIDGTDLAEITGIPDSMKVTNAKVSRRHWKYRWKKQRPKIFTWRFRCFMLLHCFRYPKR